MTQTSHKIVIFGLEKCLIWRLISLKQSNHWQNEGVDAFLHIRLISPFYVHLFGQERYFIKKIWTVNFHHLHAIYKRIKLQSCGWSHIKAGNVSFRMKLVPNFYGLGLRRERTFKLIGTQWTTWSDRSIFFICMPFTNETSYKAAVSLIIKPAEFPFDWS